MSVDLKLQVKLDTHRKDGVAQAGQRVRGLVRSADSLESEESFKKKANHVFGAL